LPQEVARVGRHGVDRTLVSVEAEIVGPFLFPPKVFFELAGESVGLRAKASREVAIAEDVCGDIGPGSLRRYDEALVLAEGDRKLGERSVAHDDGVAGVLPALVVVAVRRARLVLLEPVAIRVPVAIDPGQRSLDIGSDGVEAVAVSVPAPGARRHEHVERGRLVCAVIRSVRDEVERGELTVAYLVFDLARLHVSTVVVRVGLEGSQRSQAAEPNRGETASVWKETVSASRPNKLTNQGMPAAGTQASGSSLLGSPTASSS
jgi:hypothetical protein